MSNPFPPISSHSRILSLYFISNLDYDHRADIPKQNSLEKLLVSFGVAWPVLLNFFIQKVLQCEGVVSAIQVCHLRNNKGSACSGRKATACLLEVGLLMQNACRTCCRWLFKQSLSDCWRPSFCNLRISSGFL